MVVDVQGWIAAPVLTVAPALASALRAGPLKSSDGKRALRILTNANRYAMTTWWNDVYPSLIATPLKSEAVQLPDEAASLARTASTVSTVDSVRRLSMEAFSLATSLSTGAYNPAAAPAGTGSRRRPPPPARSGSSAQSWPAISRTRRAAGARRQRARSMPAYLGAAAWMLWPKLTPGQRSQVARMVYFEAEWGMDQPLQMYANEAGTVLQPGNTGADPIAGFHA